MHIPSLDTIFGSIGVVVVLITYGLLLTNKLSASSFNYSFFNLVGSILILYSLIYQWNFPAFTIEVAWGLISLYGIYQAKRGKPSEESAHAVMDR